MRISRWWTFLFCLLTTLIGCTPARLRSKKSIVYPITGEPKSLDPILAMDPESMLVLHQIQLGLTRRDSVGNIVPGLAERWELVNKGTRIRFYLRPANWSDGAPVRAQDFVFAWRRVLDPKLKSIWGQRLSCIQGAEAYWNGTGSANAVAIRAVTDKTLEVDLEGGRCDLPFIASFSGYVAQREDVVTAHPTSHSTPADLKYTGPFFVKRWEPGIRLVLEINTQHFGSRPQLEQIELRIRPEPSTMFNLYEQGVLDVLYPVPPADSQRVQKNEDQMLFVVDTFSIVGPLVVPHEYSKVQLLAKPYIQPFPLSITGYPAFAEVQIHGTDLASED